MSAALSTDPTMHAPPVAGRSLWAAARSRLFRNRAAVVAIATLGFIMIASLVGPLVSPHPFDRVYPDYVGVGPSLTPYPDLAKTEELAKRTVARMRAQIADLQRNGTIVRITLTAARPIDERLIAYFDRSDAFENSKVIERAEEGKRLVIETHVKTLLFLAGTDGNGRDLLTRMMIAARISMTIGLLASAVALVIGVAWGATAGYVGGRIDNLMMRVVDVLYSLPFIFFVIMLVVFFGRNFVLMFLAVGAVEWLDMARIVRGQTLSIKRQEYVQAAEALGVGTAGIIRRHIIPNTLGTVVIYLTLLVPRVILTESFLSFLGLGVQEPLTSLGVLISEGAKAIQGSTYLLIFPSIVLVAMLLSLNFLGDGLRDALDPRDR